MIQAKCPNCGSQLSYFARACRYCGASNPSRRMAILAAGALSLLGLVMVLPILVIALRGLSPGDDLAANQRAAVAGDFSWLEKAMKDCDAHANNAPDALHFLVVPLADEPPDDPGWRRISINDIGNAILISSEDMLAGLRRKALRLSTDQYVFSARNETTKEVLSWKPAVGVKKFVYDRAADIAQFRIQFQHRDAGRAGYWGATFTRQPGDCYWVNAILRHS
jgi:hypothetical protein